MRSVNHPDYSAILGRLDTWSQLGAATASNGTRLIGLIPHVGPEAYLHKVFVGLTDPQIAELEQLIARPISEELRVFLRISNGLTLFQELSVYGLRFSYNRDVDAARQPFHMKTPNVSERPKGADPAAVFFSGYSYDCSNVYMLPDSPRVYHCPRRIATPVMNQWPSLESFLDSEITRLSALFDNSGRLLNPNDPTMPKPGTYT